MSLVVGYFAADLIAGFWHWAEDRYFRSDWPVIGRHIAAPNELHHKIPTAFLEGNYWHRNSTTIIPAAVAFSVAWLLSAPTWVLATFAFVSQANELHAWSHQRISSRVIRGLQEFGLIQSARHHAVHHKSPHNVRFCVMTEWLNPVLDAFGVWRGLEWSLARVGVKVK
jgi:hypothetical protein